MCPPTTTHEASNKDTLNQKKRAMEYKKSPTESTEPPSKVPRFDSASNISVDDHTDLDKMSPILAFSILQRRQRQQMQVS